MIWEAQYGDFANGAQVIIDQFIVSSESKWGEKSRLTLLLPHGFEGNGPEHSSARLERFLKMGAEDNMTVVNPTTPAQYFHLLRLQALAQAAPAARGDDAEEPAAARRTPRRSLDRARPRARSRPCSTTRAAGDYKEDISRLVLCSGKMYYDLERHPQRAERPDVAIARIERLYPFPTEEFGRLVDSYPYLESVVWVQEEPQNMGAWRHIRHRLEQAIPAGVPLALRGPAVAGEPVGGLPDRARARAGADRASAALGL